MLPAEATVAPRCGVIRHEIGATPLISSHCATLITLGDQKGALNWFLCLVSVISRAARAGVWRRGLSAAGRDNPW